MVGPGAGHGLNKSYCNVEETESDGESGDSDVLNISGCGIPCADYTRDGKQCDTAGPTRLTHSIYSHSRKLCEDHITLCEFTPDWLPYELSTHLSDTHDQYRFMMNTLEFGDPYERHRAFFFGLDKAHVQTSVTVR